MAGRRLNLAAIETSLRRLQASFPDINAQLKDRRDPLGDDVIANMMAGYSVVDAALANGSDLMAMGNSRRLLDLNFYVLCGADRERWGEHADHLQATEHHFYDARGGGVGEIVEWHDRHRDAPVWKRAAGVYIRVLSEPQLYIEGNHRTGALIMSYILARDGRPPFVLTADNARAYFDPSSLIKRRLKGSITMLLEMPKLKKQFAEFLQCNADDRYLGAPP